MKLIYEGLPTKDEVMKSILIPGLIKRFEGKKKLLESNHEPITWIDDDGNLRSSDDLLSEETTTPTRGKVIDSGDERSMDMQMSKKELKETVAEGTAQGIMMAESLESDILNAAMRTGHRESSPSTDYHEHLDPDSPKYKGEIKKDLTLSEANVLNIVKGDR